MIEQVKDILGIEVRGFKWPKGIGFTKANERHFVSFYCWDGEIYVQNKGLMSYKDYYRMLIVSGYCLVIDGYVIGKTGYSDHFNSLHKAYLRHRHVEKKKSIYPLKESQTEMIFRTAIELFQRGVINQEKFLDRVITYIQEPFQQDVFHEIVYDAQKEAIS